MWQPGSGETLEIYFILCCRVGGEDIGRREIAYKGRRHFIGTFLVGVGYRCGTGF